MLKAKPGKISKILAIRTDRFGEFILTLPAIHALKEKFPAASISLMASSYSSQLVKNSPDINELIEYSDTDKKNFFRVLGFSGLLRAKKFDLAVIFNPKKEFNLMVFFARVPLRVGYARKWPFLLNKKIKDLKHLGLKHEVEYNLDLIKAIGVETEDRVFNISIDREDEETVNSLLSKANVDSFCVIHPWTSNAVKQWPVNRFIELSKRLVDDFKQTIVLIGGKDEISLADSFLASLGREILNLTGKLTLRQSAALLKRARFLVSNDSGPIHLAAAFNTPVVAIFRSGLPGVSSRRWGPFGSRHIIIENDNIQEISVGEVLSASKRILQR